MRGGQGDGIGIGVRTKTRKSKTISLHVQDMDDTTLVLLASMEHHLAREELLKRHIMDVNEVT